ncbi:hypothetical protein RND71_020621 [Anisodus tanguticus]|uniref:Peptidase A1 domain-containing protein n=1 Tax=Anisodus tanguticus TaxID=243964 RepID=A0AAE1S2H8_9SOLA|nr:hypothetical protein RND71_020621 [Anisodus tanguticus]
MLARGSKLEKLPNDESSLCSFCEMTVFWMQVELRKEITKEEVFEYVNQYVNRVEDNHGAHCLSGFRALDVRPLWVLGDVFLRSYHNVFYFGNLQIGFAESA